MSSKKWRKGRRKEERRTVYIALSTVRAGFLQESVYKTECPLESSRNGVSSSTLHVIIAAGASPSHRPNHAALAREFRQRNVFLSLSFQHNLNLTSPLRKTLQQATLSWLQYLIILLSNEGFPIPAWGQSCAQCSLLCQDHVRVPNGDPFCAPAEREIIAFPLEGPCKVPSSW